MMVLKQATMTAPVRLRITCMTAVPALFAISALLLALPAHADITIVLKNSFIEAVKNRVQITAQFVVDHATKPHAPKDDADIHIAGRSDDVQLPMVAEIMNAASEPAALQTLKQVVGTGEPIPVEGVWRLWTEHGGIGDQIQGDPVPVPDDTNPPHVFEIHPVTEFDNHSVIDSLRFIPGYTPKDAHDAFVKYEGLSSVITAGTDTTAIRTTMAGYNYVDFNLSLNGDQLVVDDGRFVMAKVFDSNCELLLQNRRMVFAKDSPPEKRVKIMGPGQELRVLGIPRIDLALVSWRVRCAQNQVDSIPNCAAKFPDVLQWSLPYEMIIVGVKPGSPGCSVP